VEDIILGDQYKITPESGRPTTIIPQGDEDDIGTITMVSGGVNFKTTINSSTIYRAETTNSVSITVTKTGNEDCTAATFELEFGDGLSGSGSGILGTIEPGMAKTIQVNVSCRSIEAESKFKKSALKSPTLPAIKHGMILFRLNSKETVDFNIRAKRSSDGSGEWYSGIPGVLIGPQSVYPFNQYSEEFIDSAQVAITVPRSAEDYLLVFSGATADTESIYSFAIDVQASEYLDGFINLR
jgi:hypothetical protein